MKKISPKFNYLQLSLPLVFSAIFSILFFVDLRRFPIYRNTAPSSIVYIITACFIIWAIYNLLILKNKISCVLIASVLTIIPFLLVELIFDAHWLALFMGAVFITIPLTVFVLAWGLAIFIKNKLSKKD